MKKICILLINFYQKKISPYLKTSCKYYPTCSEYTKQAIEKYGVVKGILKGIKRILRCNPFSKGGYDPLK
ncbi:MAG TPA: membrane protein insertion efficiency factor YidD [Candidatus Scatovivens faecipullorum]|jgi:hypothetical protein|nr:membrane protein insertion efficiency factor YidD [Candidatus Scatovivens faecipullorum]